MPFGVVIGALHPDGHVLKGQILYKTLWHPLDEDPAATVDLDVAERHIANPTNAGIGMTPLNVHKYGKNLMVRGITGFDRDIRERDPLHSCPIFHIKAYTYRCIANSAVGKMDVAKIPPGLSAQLYSCACGFQSAVGDHHILAGIRLSCLQHDAVISCNDVTV